MTYFRYETTESDRSIRLKLRENNSLHSTHSAHSFIDAHRKITPKSFRLKTDADQTIDKDCIFIIDDKAPNRISKFLRTRGYSQRWDGKAPSRQQATATVFDKVYKKEKTKMITEMENEMTNRERLKEKLGLKRPQAHEFHEMSKGSIIYFEEKFRSASGVVSKGRYRERMHPLCRIYQEESNKIYANRQSLSNPFQ